MWQRFSGLLHFFMQVRIKAYEPSLLAGMCILLGGYRLVRWRQLQAPVWQLLLLGMGSAVATAFIEAGYYRISMNAPMLVVLQANADFSFEVRPAWWVLAAGLGMVCLAIAGRLFARMREARAGRKAGAQVSEPVAAR